MKVIFTKTIITSILVWSLILLGGLLRSYKADSYPADNNDDGLYYVWTGNSFLKDPAQVVSHTIFDQNNPALIWRSQYMDYDPVQRFGFKISRPWFDHPPLAGILIALPARLLGYYNYEQIPNFIVRFPALILSIFTLYLTYALAKMLFGTRVALFSLLFLATVPYFVIAHRQSFLENVLTPIFLLSLVSLLKFMETKQKKYLILALMSSFLTGWCKVIGFGIPYIMAAWTWLKKIPKLAFLFLITGVASLASYIGYGLFSNKQIFMQTILNQGDRGAFFGSQLHTMTFLHFYDAFNDGWYLIAMIASISLLMLPKKNDQIKTLCWFLYGFMLMLFLLSGKMNNSPWYRYPIIPFLSISLGIYMESLFKYFKPFLFLPFFLFGLTGFDLLNIDFAPMIIRIGTIIIFIPFIVAYITQDSKLKIICIWIQRSMITVMIILNIMTILKYPSVYCSKNVCLTPQKIILE